jgi:ubiquinone/menaquinone biosynthesis C-methylase UbiE
MKILVSCALILLASSAYHCHAQDSMNHTDSKEHHHHEEDVDRDRDRWMWQLPETVMRVIGVRPGMTIADIGAGEGYFTVRLSCRVGESGRVYANEIAQSYLDAIQAECEQRDIHNVTTILGEQDTPLLPESTMDLVLLVNVTHLLDDPVLFLRNTKDCLRPGGRLAIVQWDGEKLKSETPCNEEMAASDSVRYSSERLSGQIRQAGYVIQTIDTRLPLQNIFMCTPADGE